MKLQIIEQNNQRVLTTHQLAESYGTDNRRISENFNSNKKRYKEGKHFVLLEGENLKRFGDQYGNYVSVSRVSRLYLWTEKGAWLHAKSLNTDQAWDAYEMLVDDYYSVKQNELDVSMLSPELRALINIEKKQLEQELATKKLESKVNGIRDVVALNSVDWREDARKLINKIAQSRGGGGAYREVNSEIYKEVERRGGYMLNTRLTNKRRRLADEGVSLSKRNKLTKVDVIADDKRLIEIYIAVVKEFAIKYGVESDSA